ncbi:glycosyltransferase family 2 protein [Bacillus infantis]|uniref:glycosyltransferase family 2 protein n=1 Tax=Bacillus infantis TaxID=324767 RepID=UPI00200613A4|nr:glycosyltransferase family 2 protein [Bacillus infantis]MCK6206914.1 glycosyltransferase family 2 protein [Bacillus infantis]
MPLPLVSILIPAYNRPDTIKTAIESALIQTYSCIEIIICDDSSDSRVEEMMSSCFSGADNIRYYKNEKNLFLKNWHKLLDMASGEYINYLMDDDVFDKNKIEKMMYYFQEFRDIKLVTSYRQTIDEKGNWLSPLYATERLFHETRVMEGKILADMALSRCLNIIGEPTTVLFKKEDLKEPFGVFADQQYSLLNDMAAWLNLLSDGRAVYIPEPLSFFRLHANQNNNVLGPAAFSEWLDLLVAARKKGFLSLDGLYKQGLLNYRFRVAGIERYTTDISRIDQIIKDL